MDSSGNVTVLHSFDTDVDGGFPAAPLIQANDGYFYGTTTSGGGANVNGGTVFRMDSAGNNYSVLYSFGGTSTDGQYPESPLIQANDGYFYGTTSSGGEYGSAGGDIDGTVFRIDSSGNNYVVLHSFGATSADGQNPVAAVLQATDGSLYGVAFEGGANQPLPDYSGAGTVFRIKFGQGFDSFDGGASDILWRNTQNGDVAEWKMNGLTIGTFGTVSAGLPLAWEVAGIGDFNGDLKDDILWRNTQTGDVAIWEMNGLTIVGSGTVFQGLPLEWQVAGVGDFNGDGMADILWRDTQSGDVALWEMNGLTIANSGTVYQGLPLAWQITAP